MPGSKLHIAQSLHLRRVGAVDIGTKWVGVAVCDALHISTRLLPVLERGDTLAHQVSRIVEREQLAALIIGVPLSSGRKSEGSLPNPLIAEIRDIIEQLSEILSIPVIEHDEAYSTERALAFLRQSGTRRSKRHDKTTKDGASAAVILTDFLEMLPSV